MASPSVKQKYRPSVALILIAVNLTILALPLGSLLFFRIYEGRLVHETEAELISQAAVIAAAYKQALQKRLDSTDAYGLELSPEATAQSAKRYDPVEPQIDLARDDLLPPRPGPAATSAVASVVSLDAGLDVTQLFFDARRTTLAGMVLLDHQGTVIGGNQSIGLSFAHVREVRRALAGFYSSVIRERISDEPQPSYASISRGSGIRLFAAFPVKFEKRLWGVVYMSRTPNNILKHLYAFRDRAFLVALVVLAITLLIAWVTTRTLRGPIRALSQQAQGVAATKGGNLEPLAHYGTSELATLGQSFIDMADALEKRSTYIRDFATHVSHEFKTPLTSIRGSAELLSEHLEDMKPEERARFLDNIQKDTSRLKALVDRLLELAKSDNVVPLFDDTVELVPALENIASGYSQVRVEGDQVTARIAEESLGIIASNLIENALGAGGTEVILTIVETTNSCEITFKDNGSGISPGNRAKIYDAFFTTKRETGGTGLGLGIVRSLVEAHGGEISLLETAEGAAFQITLPAASG
ncbi:MAG: HAMP domain-containing protein [Alphaproteobacteria bacterium]|nr:HAMP domain-containing protein [Alphaproteobacteria bacterium]